MHKEKSVQGYEFFKWEDFVFQEKRVSIGIVRRVSHHPKSFLKQGGNLSEVSLGSTAKVLVPILKRPIQERPFLTRPFIEGPILESTIPTMDHT
jgi:hypothetical protein